MPAHKTYGIVGDAMEKKTHPSFVLDGPPVYYSVGRFALWVVGFSLIHITKTFMTRGRDELVESGCEAEVR